MGASESDQSFKARVDTSKVLAEEWERAKPSQRGARKDLADVIVAGGAKDLSEEAQGFEVRVGGCQSVHR